MSLTNLHAYVAVKLNNCEVDAVLCDSIWMTKENEWIKNDSESSSSKVKVFDTEMILSISIEKHQPKCFQRVCFNHEIKSRFLQTFGLFFTKYFISLKHSKHAKMLIIQPSSVCLPFTAIKLYNTANSLFIMRRNVIYNKAYWMQLYFIAAFIIESGNNLLMSASIEMLGLAGFMLFHCILFYHNKKNQYITVTLLSTDTQMFLNVLLPSHPSDLQTLLHLCSTVKHKRQIWISCHIPRTLCFITSDDCVAEIGSETCLTA